MKSNGSNRIVCKRIKMHDTNANVIFPGVAKTYYKKGVICPEFPWNKRQLATEYVESSRRKEVQLLELEDAILLAKVPIIETKNPKLSEQDQEGSTMDEPSRTSILDTPALTIKDSQFLEIR